MGEKKYIYISSVRIFVVNKNVYLDVVQGRLVVIP